MRFLQYLVLTILVVGLLYGCGMLGGDKKEGKKKKDDKLKIWKIKLLIIAIKVHV